MSKKGILVLAAGFQVADIRIYIMNAKDEVITKTQVPIWDIPIGRELVRREGDESAGRRQGGMRLAGSLVRRKGDESAGRRQGGMRLAGSLVRRKGDESAGWRQGGGLAAEGKQQHKRRIDWDKHSCRPAAARQSLYNLFTCMLFCPNLVSLIAHALICLSGGTKSDAPLLPTGAEVKVSAWYV